MRWLGLLLALLAAPATAQAASFTGTYRLPAAAAPAQIVVELERGRATVALGPGHSSRTHVRAQTGARRVRFTFPGGMRFDGVRAGANITGLVAQDALRGTFHLSQGRAPVLSALGLYRSSPGTGVVIVAPGAGLPTWLVELPSGHVHGLGPGLRTVGARAGQTSGDGVLSVHPDSLVWTNGGASTRYARLPLRQREVRIGALGATLTLPPGSGPFPAVAMVHGSGPLGREEFQVFAAYCELNGIAVLADDKRGIGQSRGTYPGEAATARTLGLLARDAQAEVRWLTKAPHIDPTRIGLFGDSQAGWVVALAAAREPAIRFAVPLAGPTVSVGTTDTWASLAGKGEYLPTGSPSARLEQARSASGGFDPVPFLRRIAIPIHWVFTDDDRNVPTVLCIESLEELRSGHDYSWDVVPGTHTLLELPSGLNRDIPRSRGFAPGLFPSVGAFLRRIGVARHR